MSWEFGVFSKVRCFPPLKIECSSMNVLKYGGEIPQGYNQCLIFRHCLYTYTDFNIGNFFSFLRFFLYIDHNQIKFGYAVFTPEVNLGVAP